MLNKELKSLIKTEIETVYLTSDDEKFLDEGEYKNHLDDLLKVRQYVNPKIKFEIVGSDEKERKIFEFAGLF